MAIQSYCLVLDMIDLSGTREREFSFFLGTMWLFNIAMENP